jgi:FkbM family methyltransferase
MNYKEKLKKPEYLNNLLSIFKRFNFLINGVKNVKLVWGDRIEVNVNESIGKSIYRFGLYDLAVTELLFRLIKPGDLVIDVGANIGYMSKLACFLTGPFGQVIAYEPNAKLKDRLFNNLKDCNNISIEYFGLSDTNGQVQLNIPEQFASNEGIAFIGDNSNILSSNFINIEIKKFDDIIFTNKRIDLMKIDVEGHELNVLKGAEKSLKEKNILNIVYEDHLQFPSSVSDYLLSMGYYILRIEKRKNNIFLADPLSASSISSWEPTNYLATLDKSIVNYVNSVKRFICYDKL